MMYVSILVRDQCKLVWTFWFYCLLSIFNFLTAFVIFPAGLFLSCFQMFAANFCEKVTGPSLLLLKRIGNPVL